MNKLLYFFIFFLSWTANSFGQEKIEFQPDGLYLKNISTQKLERIYNDYKYKDYIYMPDWKYPPIFLETLPKDFPQITDTQKRNRLFLQILAPIALKINRDLFLERYEIEELSKQFHNSHDLTSVQIKFLEDKAVQYDIFTRLKGERRYAYILNELLMKVDMVPASLLMGVAAIESNWGTNRPAMEGNSLYRTLVWHTNEGLKPQDETEDDSYRYKIYPTLYDSMNAYALKLNSNINYEHMRTLRSQIRKKERPVFGRTLAHAMVFDSNLQNFAGILDYTITFYELINLDEAELQPLDLPK